MSHTWENEFTCDDGTKLVNVHDESPDCHEFGCVIHNPTDPHQDWPTVWDATTWPSGQVKRRGPDGKLYDDKDVLAFEARRGTNDLRSEVIKCLH